MAAAKVARVSTSLLSVGSLGTAGSQVSPVTSSYHACVLIQSIQDSLQMLTDTLRRPVLVRYPPHQNGPRQGSRLFAATAQCICDRNNMKVADAPKLVREGLFMSVPPFL